MGQLDLTITTAHLQDLALHGATSIDPDAAVTSYGAIGVSIEVAEHFDETRTRTPALSALRHCIEHNGVITT